jgi:sodium transport system permease protein
VRLRPVEAILLYVAVAFLLVGGSLFVSGLGGLAAAEWAFIALPVLLTAQARTGNLRETLAVRLPSARAAIGAVLVGASLWLVLDLFVVSLQEKLFPTPKALDQYLEQLISGSLWPTLLVIALTPAICEELLCRGAIARALAGWSRWGAVLVSAALFALLHIDPHRLLPTFLLGIALGAIALRSGSTIASMIVHALNNGAIIVISGSPAIAHGIDHHPLPVGFGAVILSVSGFFLVFHAKVTDTTLL